MRLLMLVEGQSEEIFVNRTLKPYLEERDVYVQPPIVLWTKRQPAGVAFDAASPTGARSAKA